jgi:hypothetical protein
MQILYQHILRVHINVNKIYQKLTRKRTVKQFNRHFK